MSPGTPVYIAPNKVPHSAAETAIPNHLASKFFVADFLGYFPGSFWYPHSEGMSKLPLYFFCKLWPTKSHANTASVNPALFMSQIEGKSRLRL